MGTRPLTQRLYDKTKADLADFRNNLAEWHVKQSANGFTFSGTAIDLFWQQSQKHLEAKIAEYFEWIEKESTGIAPASLRAESIDQCVGAVVTYGRDVRKATVQKNRILQQLSKDVDHGQWLGVDDNSIHDRGQKLLLALGLGAAAPMSAKLNHFVNDHKWLPLLFSIISIVIALAAFFRT